METFEKNSENQQEQIPQVTMKEFIAGTCDENGQSCKKPENNEHIKAWMEEHNFSFEKKYSEVVIEGEKRWFISGLDDFGTLLETATVKGLKLES